MTIGIITPSFPTKEGRGGYFFVEQIVIQFSKLGHKCVVISPINIASRFFIRKPYGPYHESTRIDDNNSIDIYRPRFFARNLTIDGVSWAANSMQSSIERTIKEKKLKIISKLVLILPVISVCIMIYFAYFADIKRIIYLCL